MNAFNLAGRFVPAPFVFALCALSSFSAHADHAPAHQLDTVSVTATNPSTQNSAADARAEVARTAGGATVVEGADLRDQRAGTLSDALGQAAGVFAQSRFGAQEMRLSIRGSGLQRTFHTRGITVLQDGVPLNLADGSGDFQSIDTLAASHIELFRGANALQYGSGTLGGSVNFVTDTGYTAGRELRVEGGSFGYGRAYASSGFVDGNLDGFTSLGYFGQDGFRDHSQQREFRFTSNLGVRLANGIENRTFLTATRSDSELPGSLTKAQLEANPRQANPGNGEAALDQRRDTKVLRLANKTVTRVSDNTTAELALYAARKRLDHPIFQVLLQDNFDYGLSLRFVNSGSLLGHSNRWVLGLNPQHGVTKGDSFVNVVGSGARGARTDRYTQTADNLIVYGENQFGLTQQLTLVGGAQVMTASRDNRDQFIAPNSSDGSYNASYNASYTGFSPKVGAIYALQPAVQLFGNVAGSFEPPSFGEGPQAIAGGPLKAQRAVTAELGSRGKSGIFNWDVSVYRAEIKNELLALQVPVGGNQTSGVTVNAESTIHQGIESSVSVQPLRWATVRLNALYNDFKLDDDASFANNRLPGVPKALLRSEWRADIGQQFVALTTETASKTYIDYANSFSADGYTIFGVKAGGALLPTLSWFAEARNLADEKYASSNGVIRNANGMDQPQFLPGDGRSVYAGLTWAP